MTPKAKPKGRNVAQQVVQEMITEDEWRRAAEALWEIATQGTRMEWAYCEGCNRKVQFERPDLRARTEALQRLQEMGYGRPREDEQKQSLLVNRTIVRPRGLAEPDGSPASP
jgi:hypothetical protein